MRPRYLEIEGLQSFKELQRIDFDKLSETGLFGIFGPTGSGKSTILDAITLALYGSVHRAVKGTQGIVNTDMGGIKVSFTFDLAKEGIRKTYRVERQYKRKKDSESSVEAKLVRLLEVDDRQEYILADKHSEVNSYIIQLVGLKFEDFTRSVVLPQNKFQEFLLSPRGEKTKMLERIFYLEEFGRRLVDKVNREMAVVKNKLSNIEGALSTLGISSPEALIEGERKLKEAQEARKTSASKLKASEETYSRGMELYKLSKEYEELQQKFVEYKGRQDEIQRLEEICMKSEAANAIKPLVLEYKEAKKGLNETNTSLNDIIEQLKLLEAEKALVEQTHDNTLKLKDQQLPELIRHRTMLQECQIMQQEMEELTKLLTAARKEYSEINLQMEETKKAANDKAQQKETLSKEVAALEQNAEAHQVDNNKRKQISQGVTLEKELQGFEANLNRQTVKYNELNKSMEAYRGEYDKIFKLLNSNKGALNVLNEQKEALETASPINKDEISKQNNKIIVAENLLQNIVSSSDSIKVLEIRIKDYCNQAMQLNESIEELEKELNSRKEEAVQMNMQLDELAKHQKQHTAVLLSKGLIKGEKCPVCGSIDHPQPAAIDHDEEFIDLEKIHVELQEAINAKQQHIRELEHEVIKLKQQHSSLTQINNQANAELEGKQRECKNLRQLLPEIIQTLETEGIQAYIRAEKESTERASLEYSVWEQKLTQLNEDIKKQEAELSELKVQESRLAALLENTKTTLVQEQSQLEDYKKSHHDALTKYQEMKQNLSIGSFLQEAEIIAHKDEQTQNLTAMIKQKRTILDALTIEHQTLLEKITQITDMLTEKKSEGIKLKEQKEEKERKIISLIGDRSIQLELEKNHEEMNSIETAYKTAYDKLNVTRNALEGVYRRKAGLQSSLQHYQETIESDGKKLQEAFKAKGFTDEEHVEQCMLDNDKLELYQEEIAKYKREKASTEDRLQIIIKQLEGKVLSEQQWQLLYDEYQQAKVEQEEKISQLEAAKSNYQQIKESFEKWIKLQEELKSISKRKDMLEQIQKLLKGNGFIEFISEERMRYIAREASETLGELTKFRYSIELDSENGFVIRDDANGGVLRSVASLSGGETFLTSLSLALALSSQLQLKGQSPLEFFFLDEGFGTLDNTLLDTVIDSLERLSSNKRIIGLISHVPEMKNRINRRLIVDAPDRGGKGSRISIEKA